MQSRLPFPETGRFTLPALNSPMITTGAIIASIFGVCGTGAGIPTDWLINCPQALTLGQWAFQQLAIPGGCNLRLRRRFGQVYRSSQ